MGNIEEKEPFVILQKRKAPIDIQQESDEESKEESKEEKQVVRR